MWRCEPQPEARRVCECGGASRSRRRGESVNLVGFLPNEVEELAVELGAARDRGRQLATWIYRKSVFDLDTMSDLPKDFRARLAERATIHVPEPERVTASQDGSRKLVFRLGDAGRISSVLMPDDDRLTLCVSTQVGCGFECRFCLTGVMGFARNLSASEIVGQVLAANRLLEGGQRVTHIVFMGMGEPLANYAALVQALRILTDAKLGLGYSPRRITVSTEDPRVPVDPARRRAHDDGAVEQGRGHRRRVRPAEGAGVGVSPRTVSFATLGCRLNQADSQQLQTVLESRGFRTVPLGEPADMVVVNTCTVTARAEFSERQAIRRAARVSPRARLVVTGCWAQTSPDRKSTRLNS